MKGAPGSARLALVPKEIMPSSYQCDCGYVAHFFQVSPPTVHQMILTLEKKGLIRRTPGAARSLKVLVPAEQLARLR